MARRESVSRRRKKIQEERIEAMRRHALKRKLDNLIPQLVEEKLK